VSRDVYNSAYDDLDEHRQQRVLELIGLAVVEAEKLKASFNHS